MSVISVYRPFFNWSEFLAVLQPGAGRSDFEAAVAERTGARYGVAFAYGRSGVVALLKALELNQVEVIMPAYTCSVIIEAVIASGNIPVFVDIDLTDYNMDIGAIKAAVTPQTRAIVATHMHGYPTDIAAIRREIGDERILVIEDSALALRPAWSSAIESAGDVTLFSFGRGKQLYTISGGVMTTNSATLYERLKAYRDTEMNRLPGSALRRRCLQLLTAYLAQSAALESSLSRIKNVGPVKQARDAVGLVRALMPRDYATAYADFQGRLGMAQLRKLEVALERNTAIAEFYSRELQNVSGLRPAPIIPGSTYARYSMQIERRDEMAFSRRMRDQGVEVGLNFNYALPCLKPYQTYARGRYPLSEQAAAETVNLPIYPGLSMSEARHVVTTTQRVLQEVAPSLA